MSQLTKSQLQNNINTDIADNSTGAISAGDVRGNMINITDSLLFLTGSATQTIVGNINVLGAVTGSFTGSFQGNGSNLTGVIGEWDGSLNGNASITGSLTVTGNTTLGDATTDVIVANSKTYFNPLSSNPPVDAAVNIFTNNLDYGLYVKGFNYFEAGDTLFKNHDLYFEGSTMYLGSNAVTPTVIPFSDSANIGFAVARPNNDTTQQLILNYQGGTGRIIAKETNASAPQLRIELFDGSTTTEALRFQKTSVIINTSLLPTTEPSTPGQMWLSGSAGSNSKVLCVRN